MTRSRNILFAIGLATAVFIPACMVSGGGTMSASTTAVVYSEPPPDQVEPVTVRPGQVWIKGRWDWRNGQWVWVSGRWEAERQGRTWSHGRWERRGNQWHWIEGTWVASSDPGGGAEPYPEPVVRDHRDPDRGRPMPGGGGYPTAAPPPLRTESYGAARSGYIWVSGHWDWRNGQWAWVDGHWERAQANKVWVPGRWELQGNYYVWIEGRWDRGGQPPGPVVRDHRD